MQILPVCSFLLLVHLGLLVYFPVFHIFSLITRNVEVLRVLELTLEEFILSFLHLLEGRYLVTPFGAPTKHLKFVFELADCLVLDIWLIITMRST